MRSGLLVYVVLLTACSPSRECAIADYPAPEAEDPGSWSDLFKSTDSCVTHWARQYAKSNEGAQAVATAAVQKCSTYIRLIADLSQKPGDEVPTTSAREVLRSHKQKALIAVVRYRKFCEHRLF